MLPEEVQASWIFLLKRLLLKVSLNLHHLCLFSYQQVQETGGKYHQVPPSQK
jgi:hypothetical protein